MGRWFGRKEPQHISARTFIDEKPQAQQRLEQELDALLDQILNLFPSGSGVMAEILVPSQGSGQLITSRIRPDESVALPIRVQLGEGTIGTVFEKGKPFAGSRSEAARQTHSGSAGDVTHLLRTQSLLVIPLMGHGRQLGILNLESPREETLTEASLARVQESAPYKSLLDHLARMQSVALSDEEIFRDLVDRLRQQVAFAIDPNDLESTYYQILQASAQIINAADISAGLVLVRDDSLRLSPVTGESYDGKRQLWAVLAAKLGAFNSDPEWKLEETSIAGRIVRTKKSENIPNVRGYPGYRDSGTGFTESSELIVPLIDGDHAIGVIGLVSPALGTFTETDQRHVEEIATIAVLAIKRGEEILAAKRSEKQLQLAGELNEDFKALFPPSIEDIRGLNIREIRNRMYDKILHWAREYTGANHAAIVLPEIIRDSQGRATVPVYLTVHRDLGEHLDKASPRWVATEGVTGKAFSDGQTAEKQDIVAESGDSDYVSYYVDARSEVAAPMKRGNEVIGVLDVESKTKRHFTTTHIRWVEFLAAQAALVLIAAELALKTQFELKLERMERDTDETSENIRFVSLDKVRPIRDAQLRAILNGVREITGSSVGRILIAMNAYQSTQLGAGADSADLEHGVLYFMVSTDESETARDAVRYFPITEGASGTAFREGRAVIFRDEASREAAHFSLRRRNSLSGMVVPLYEGPRRVGVAGFEADRQDAYTPDYVVVGRRAAAMISRLLMVARLRISRSTLKMLRDFESSILQLENKTIESFMEEVLQRTAQLSDIKEGWAQVILLRPTTDVNLLIADRTFRAEYHEFGVRHFDPGRSETYDEIQAKDLRDAIKDQRPVLVLDASQSNTDLGLPWPAKSCICVPLLRPNEIDFPAGANATQPQPQPQPLNTQSASMERAIGLLVVASPNRSEFSEADKEILAPFTQTIVYGLQTLALLGARQELMAELTHDFTSAYPSLQLSIMDVQDPLMAALDSEDVASIHQDIRDVNGQIVQLKALVRLTQNMLGWFFALADDDIGTRSSIGRLSASNEESADTAALLTPETRLSVEKILRDIDEPISTLADLRRELTIRWEYPTSPLYVVNSRDADKLIAAVLFKFLDNAIKKTEKDDIRVTCGAGESANGEPRVIFKVINSGRPIDSLDRPLLFKLRYRPGSEHGGKSSGIGLYQAGVIAKRLGGDVGYEADDQGHNVFWLSLPAADGQTL